MHAKRLLGLVGVIAAVAFLITSAGAGASAIPKIDLSTKAGVAKYLKSIGVNPKGVVIQRGLRNYAGPSCPGARWHCTNARHVFQIAAAGGNNKVDCTNPAYSGGPGIDQDCEVTQNNINGKNEAVCREDLTQSPSAVQNCEITQTNVNGDNKATVDQKIKQKDGASQTAIQTSEVDQTNTAGKNDAKVKQDIDQDTHGAVDQDQEATQSSCVKQHGPDNPQGACNEAFPPSGATGGDSSDVNQSVHQGEHAADAVVDLNQDSSVDGHVSQDTTAVATNHNGQDEHQIAEGKNASVSQSGPMHCCTEQGTNANDKFDVDQDSHQQTNATSYFQDEEIVGTCETTGNCKVDQSAKQNDANLHNTCEGTSCSTGIVCTSEAGEGNFGLCEPCTPDGEGGCSTSCIDCLTTFSLKRPTARPAVRPQAVRLLQRSALLH